MIRPPGFRGTAFGTLADGDLRKDRHRRATVSAELGIDVEWAFVNQVHGDHVFVVTQPGLQGDGDAMLTTTPGIPLVVATADCVPIVLEGPGVAAVVHAGWRGAVAGVVEATLQAIERQGRTIERAAIGPAIGPSCYEVGDEVAARFPGFVRTTSWGSQSIDLPASIGAKLDQVDVWTSGVCTFSDDRYASHRRNGTPERQVAVVWLPTG